MIEMGWFVIINAAMSAFAGGVGALVALSFSRRERRPAPLVAMCSCEHGFGKHDDEGCRSTIQRETGELDNFGNPTAYEWVECACARYDGPDPEQLRLLRGA